MSSNKFIFEGAAIFDREDSGCAYISTIDSVDKDSHLFIRLHSWDDDGIHPELAGFEGKKIKITVEVE